jgi:hypothetical protein
MDGNKRVMRKSCMGYNNFEGRKPRIPHSKSVTKSGVRQIYPQNRMLCLRVSPLFGQKMGISSFKA